MKRLIICAAILTAGYLAVDAQRTMELDKIGERLEAQRVAYITNALDLSVEESTQFWPIYNDYKKSEKEMREEIRPEGSVADLSEEEAAELLDDQLELESRLIELRRDYIDKLKAVISSRKILRLNQIEREFNRSILEKLRQRQNAGGRRN